MKHGGKRGGAGRPKGSATKVPTKVVSIRLQIEMVEAHKINSDWLLDAVMRKIGRVILTL